MTPKPPAARREAPLSPSIGRPFLFRRRAASFASVVASVDGKEKRGPMAIVLDADPTNYDRSGTKPFSSGSIEIQTDPDCLTPTRSIARYRFWKPHLSLLPLTWDKTFSRAPKGLSIANFWQNFTKVFILLRFLLPIRAT